MEAEVSWVGVVGREGPSGVDVAGSGEVGSGRGASPVVGGARRAGSVFGEGRGGGLGGPRGRLGHRPRGGVGRSVFRGRATGTCRLGVGRSGGRGCADRGAETWEEVEVGPATSAAGFSSSSSTSP